MKRSTQRALVTAVLAAVAVAACDPSRLAEPASRASSIRVPVAPARWSTGIVPGMQYGISFQGDSLNSYANDLRAAQYLAAAGVRFARVTAYWYDLQQFGDNTFTPWSLAAFHEIVQALQDAGITPYITLEASACFAVSETFPCGDVYNPPDNEAHWQAWTTYVQQMTQEFPTVQYWGIWNEPNASGFLYPQGGDRLAAYKKLVERAAPAIRAAGGTVIGPDLGDGSDPYNQMTAVQWLTNFLSTHGSYIDVVAVHLYGQVTTSDYLTKMGAYANVLGSGPWDLWLTETALDGNNRTDLEQAVNLRTVYRAMNSRSIPRWGKTFYMNAGVFVPPFAVFGIVHDIGTTHPVPRPAYDSLAAISSVPLPPESFGDITISGPFTVSGCTFASWSATPNGGTPPYRYVWTVDGSEIDSGSFPSVGYANDGSTTLFFVDVTATDANGRTGSSGGGVKIKVALPGSC